MKITDVKYIAVKSPLVTARRCWYGHTHLDQGFADRCQFFITSIILNVIFLVLVLTSVIIWP